MAKYRVGNGTFDARLSTVLKTVKVGDEIIFKPGEYDVDSLTLNGVNLTSLQEPGQVIIRGQLSLQGTSTLRNLTFMATPFHNALGLYGSTAELKNCVVQGEPAGKYPTIYLEGANLTLEGTKVSCNAQDGVGIDASKSSVLVASQSSLGVCHLRSSKATLNNVFATDLAGFERSQIDSNGFLNLQGKAGYYALRLTNESFGRIAELRANEPNSAAYCEDGYIKIDSLSVPEGQNFRILTRGQSTVDAPQPAIEVVNLDAGPKDVLWELKDARNFAEAVRPSLNAGDTLVLQEGEYFLEDVDSYLHLQVNIRGIGRGEKTILHGTLSTAAETDLSIENLTLRTVGQHNGIMMLEGNTLNLSQVTIEHAEECKLPLLVAHRGELRIVNTTVRARTDIYGGATWIDGEATLIAKSSSLGWVDISKSSRAQLETCTALQLYVHDKATAETSGVFGIESNSLDAFNFLVHEQGKIRVQQLELLSDEGSGQVLNGELRIEKLNNTGQVKMFIEYDQHSTVEVADDRIEMLKLEPELVDSSGQPHQEEAEEQHEVDAQAAHSAASTQDDAAGVPSGDEPAFTGDPLAKIDGLIGLSKVKAQITKFTQMVRFNQMRAEQGLKTTGVSMHSMFLGNPGTGKTTVARLLGEALFQAGAIEKNVFVEVGRKDLVGQHLGASALMTQKVLEKAHGGILFIDEAYSLYQENSNSFGEEAVDTILTYMENHRDEIVVIFAGYSSEMQDFLGMNPGLKSRIPNRFDFEDYTGREIAQIGYAALLEADYTVDEELYTRSVIAKYAQSSDNSNGRWVRNFNEELYQQLAQRVFSAPINDPSDLTEITPADIAEVMGGDREAKQAAVQGLLAELDALIGLDSVKDWVRQLVNRVTVDQRRQDAGQLVQTPNYHMIFSGNPGTGKTTVAKIIAQLFYNLGILENGTVKSVDRTGLVGQYIGHTEKQVTKVVDEALGGVLFIDEAYQLGEGSANDFGRQAVETLITRLEDDRGKFVAIFAGYTNKMEDFLAINPGLPSRIPLQIEFPDYSAEDVAQMVCSLLAKSWEFDREALTAKVTSVYEGLESNQRDNGRWARNYFEIIERAHIDYIATNDIHGEAMQQIDPRVIAEL